MGKRAGSSEKVAEWTARLERLNASGLSVARFCEREGVSAVFGLILAEEAGERTTIHGDGHSALRSTAETGRADRQDLGWFC